MFRPPHSLLAALTLTTIVVTAGLCWAGWRLLDQQRSLDDQRAWDRIESTADAMAADVRGALAETAERLSVWLADPTASPPRVEGAVVVTMSPEHVRVTPEGALPFVPSVAADPPAPAETFAAIEAMEFRSGRSAAAADAYRRLTSHPDPRVRAGAWLRLARILRTSNDFDSARTAYEHLSTLSGVRIDGVPAELVALNGQRVAARAAGDAERERRATAQVVDGLTSGRWQITRGVAEFYREQAGSTGRSDTWALADALADVWGGRTLGAPDNNLPPRGLRVSTREHRVVLVMWRSSGTRTALLAAFPQTLFVPAASASVAWQLADPEGQVIVGDSVETQRTAARVIGNVDYPWTLRVWPVLPAPASVGASRGTLLTMMAGMLTFVWVAAYFMGRAIRREAAVARLQADFVAAVSHEFRSPLTTVRQMAEMLDMGRLQSDERRQTYYRVITSETARLQRLVETLLNFGRMEAGSARYRFEDVDAASLVRQVIGEMEPQARDAAITIVLDSTDDALVLVADDSALSIAVRNLIDNAIKYSPRGSTVFVRWACEGGSGVIAVTDHGTGIPRSEQRTIFRKFVRGRAAIEGNVTGTGVGLSMVQQIVAAHGGEVRVDSEPGRGSTFTVRLPLQAPAARARVSGRREPEVEPGA